VVYFAPLTTSPHRLGSLALAWLWWLTGTKWRVPIKLTLRRVWKKLIPKTRKATITTKTRSTYCARHWFICITYINSFYSQIKPMQDEETGQEWWLAQCHEAVKAGRGVGLRGRPRQNGPLRYEHYLGIKSNPNPADSEETLYFPLNCLLHQEESC